VRPVVLALVAAAVLAGCGGDDGGGGGPSGSAATPDALVSEAKHGLDAALAEYRDGDRSAAADRLKQARDDNVPRFEPALRKIDAPLASRVHRTLYTELPKLIDDGVTVSVLAERLAGAEVDLDDAVVKLRTP
jgi:hypothetical protein